MRCFECGGEVIQTIGSVRMTKKDGELIIFRGIPLSQPENKVDKRQPHVASYSKKKIATSNSGTNGAVLRPWGC